MNDYLPDPANDETLTMSGYEWWHYYSIIEQNALLKYGDAIHFHDERSPNEKCWEFITKEEKLAYIRNIAK